MHNVVIQAGRRYRGGKEGFLHQETGQSCGRIQISTCIFRIPSEDLEIIGGNLDWLVEIENRKWEMDRGTSRRLL